MCVPRAAVLDVSPSRDSGRLPEPGLRYVPRGGYGIHRRDLGWLAPAERVPQTSEWSPKWGSDIESQDLAFCEGGGNVKLLKRLAVAMGSLLALAFAGGAHVRW